MIKSKKIVIAAALCAFTAALSFAQEVTFENKLSSGLVNIDITDDNMVLYRKNIVIKNIVFVVNLLYTLIFTIITLGNPSIPAPKEINDAVVSNAVQ